MGAGKAKFKLVSSGSKLKAAIAKLPPEGVKFEGLRGREKGKDDGPESIGIWLMPGGAADLAKAKAKVTSGQFFKGVLRPSAVDPRLRVVVETKNSPRPLLEVVRGCFKDSGVKHKPIVLQEGAPEPSVVDDDDDDTAIALAPQRPTQPLPNPSGPTGKPTPTVPTQQPQPPSLGVQPQPQSQPKTQPTPPVDPQAAARARMKGALGDIAKRSQKPATREGMGTAPPTLGDLAHGTPLDELDDDDARTARDDAQAGLKALGVFHGNLSREEAEQRLANAGPGAHWLLRWSDNGKEVIVSSRTAEGKFQHARTISDKGVSLTREEVANGMKGLRPLKQTASAGTRDAGQAPQPGGVQAPPERKAWELRAAKVKRGLGAAVLEANRSGNPALKTQAAEIARQLKASEQSADSGDYARAGSLMGAVETSLADLVATSENLGKVTLAMRHCDEVQDRLGKLFAQLEKAKGVSPQQFDRVEEAVMRRIQDPGTVWDRDRLDEATERAEAGIREAEAALAGAQWKQQIDIKQYAKSKVLGAGAFGEVHLLQSKKPGAPTLVCKTPLDKQRVDEMKHEEEIYRKVGDHPNIARCLGRQKIDGKEALVLEGIGGGDMTKGMDNLRKRLDKGEIKQEEYWGVLQFSLLKTLQALDHMSKAGFSHVDIKPDNIMFDDKSGEPKLVDMGLAAVKGQGGGGTPGFATTANFETGKAGEKDDVFAVGATAFEGGEKERFKYNQTDKEFGRQGQNGLPGWFNGLKRYTDNEEDAIEVTPDLGGSPMKRNAPDGEDPGRRQKPVGKAKANTAYTEFVNWLLAGDEGKRPTAAEALKHPFLQDMIISQDQARELIRGLNK